MTAKLRAHTIKDTGETVQLRAVSPLIAQQVRKQFPAPTPPLNEVDYGGGDVRLEPNRADPDYTEAYEAWGAQIEEKTRRLYVKLGVVIDWTEERRERLALTRELLGEEGVEIDPDDTVAYMSYCAIGSAEDYQELVEAIMRRSAPTEEAIAEAVETFRPDVEG